VPIGKEEMEEKEKYLETNNVFNLSKVHRERSDFGVISDYPHYYTMKEEGKEKVLLQAIRATENCEFIISCQEVRSWLIHKESLLQVRQELHWRVSPQHLGHQLRTL